MMADKIGIIGGTGMFEDIKRKFDKSEEIIVATPYGSVELWKCIWENTEIYYVARHGKDHTLPPHKVHYKANIWALSEMKVDRIYSTSAVGSLNRKIPPGKIVIPNQIMDFTKFVYTFYDGGKNGVKHIDMTEPFCTQLREILLDIALSLGLEVVKSGTYACFSGPAFETPAEVKMLKKLGADIVGMTVSPEARLSREKGICYQAICMTVNWASGIVKERVSHKKNLQIVNLMKSDVLNLLALAIKYVPMDKTCRCSLGGD